MHAVQCTLHYFNNVWFNSFSAGILILFYTHKKLKKNLKMKWREKNAKIVIIICRSKWDCVCRWYLYKEHSQACNDFSNSRRRENNETKSKNTHLKWTANWNGRCDEMNHSLIKWLVARLLHFRFYILLFSIYLADNNIKSCNGFNRINNDKPKNL